MKLARYIIVLIGGLTFGMLFAPKKGKDLRDEILKKGKTDGAESLRALGSAFKDAGEDALGELKSLSDHEQVAAFLELSNEKIKGFLENAEEKGYNVATVLQDKLEYLHSVVKNKTEEVQDEVGAVKKEVVKKVKKVKKAVKAQKNSPFIKRKVKLVKKAKKTVEKTVAKAKKGTKK